MFLGVGYFPITRFAASLIEKLDVSATFFGEE
jgi:hypothetical protein